jgi:predicted ABC-type ATPase
MPVPRLRVFAGPNGSGKSTIKSVLSESQLYIYVNADDLEKEANQDQKINLVPFGLTPTQQAFDEFFITHPLINRFGLAGDMQYFTIAGTSLNIGATVINSYHASVIADFVRHQLLHSRKSFTFETVMSDPSKIEFMRKARANGYRTYLYFVSTESPEININRVEIRVKEGGHAVKPEKIRLRYDRCLALLPQAILETDRAYIFDNSGDESELEAKITDGEVLEYKIEYVHDWCIEAMDAFRVLIKQRQGITTKI